VSVTQFETRSLPASAFRMIHGPDQRRASAAVTGEAPQTNVRVFTRSPAALQAQSGSAAAVPGGTAEREAQERQHATLRLFVREFGLTNGSQWFAAGKTYAEALTLHSRALVVQLAAAAQRRQELESQLNAQRLQQNIGTNMAKIAASLTFAHR